MYRTRSNYIKTYPPYYAYSTYHPKRASIIIHKKTDTRKKNIVPIVFGAIVLILLSFITYKYTAVEKIDKILLQKLKENTSEHLLIKIYYNPEKIDETHIKDYFSSKNAKLISIKSDIHVILVELSGGDIKKLEEEDWFLRAEYSGTN